KMSSGPFELREVACAARSIANSSRGNRRPGTGRVPGCRQFIEGTQGGPDEGKNRIVTYQAERRLILLLFAMIMMLPACSGSGSSSPAAAPAPAPDTDPPEVQVG